MPLYHLQILTHFNRARDELDAAEGVLSDLLEGCHGESGLFLLQLTKEVVIEINRVEYLIRQELKRREKEISENSLH